jgi:hypothetical protein
MSTFNPSDGCDFPATAAPNGAAAPARPAGGDSIGERLLANIDNVALALGVVAFFVANSLGPAYSCGSSYVEDTSTAFNVLMVVSPLSFAVAAFAALGCRRHVVAKGAAFLTYGVGAFLSFVILALTASPCAFY